MKAKGDKASYAYANPTAKVLGALYKEKAGLQSVDIAYRTGADFLNDLSSGAIDYAIPDNVQAMAQRRAGHMKILGVGAGERMKSAPEISDLDRAGLSDGRADLVGCAGAVGDAAAARRSA